jgi:hypothetical protein
MIVKSTEIPHFCALASNGSTERLRSIGITGYSLDAIVGLATQSRFLSEQGNSACLEFLSATEGMALDSALSCLNRSTGRKSKASSAPKRFEFYRLGTPADLLSDQFDLFCDRFRRGLQARWARSGYTPLIQGLAEIADNVFEHSGNVGQRGCAALAGYHLDSERAVFSVADAGQGLLGSLKQSERWRDLASDRDAIKAVVENGATSRPKEDTGGGFKQLFGSLVDFNALVVVRSGTCVGKVFQKEGTRRLDTTVGSGAAGVQVSVILGNHRKAAALE